MPASSTQNEIRTLRQQLESLARAGLTHLPRADNVTPPSAQAVENAPLASPVPPSSPPDLSGQPRLPGHTPFALAGTDMARAKSSLPAATDKSAPLPAAPRTTRSKRSRQERTAELQVLAETVARCVRCKELARTRNKTVFGVGNPTAKILFIGEAPGADEDRQGEPFVGRAGQLLTKIIEACRLSREEVYICNILKCRPPENRTPLPPECANCREYLLAQLDLVDPDYIVCCGTVAAQNLLQSELTIGKLRGKLHPYGRAKVLCTYHPSYLLRNPAAKKDVWEDMKFLFADMGITL